MRRHLSVLFAFCFVALRSFAAITGVVMTNDGQPISGAHVSIRAFESTDAARVRLLSATPEAVPLLSAQTDSKGTFSLESPKDATVDLSIVARGYEPQQRRIERDEEVGAIVLTKAETRKATVTAGGKPLPNALVVIHYRGYEYQAKTDAQGRYEAPDPKSARSIAVIHPDFAVQDETFLSINGVSASVLNRTIAPGTAFKGRVVAGDKEVSVAKATVLVDSWPVAITADDGTFSIAHMPTKWTTITARKDSLLGQRAYAKESSATIRIANGAILSGRITDAKSRVPVVGAIVRAGTRRFGPGPDLGVSALTDAKGAYSLVVPAGTYSVMAAHPGYDMKPADASAVAGQTTTKDLALTALARVSGTVVDESKRPVVVAVIDTDAVESGGMRMPRMMMTRESTVSGPDGRFSLRIQPETEQFVRATKRGFPAAKSDAFHAASGERKTGMVLTIPSGIAVSGRAIDVNGDPLSGVAVTAAEVENGQRGMMMRMFIGGPNADDDAVRTASDGTFTMRVKEGTYDFTFRREGLAPKTVRSLSITPTSSPNVEAKMEEAAEITGRVVRNGMGLENVNLFGMAPGSGSVSAVTGPDGSFTLSGLAPGSIRVMVRKDDEFVQETRNLTAPARDVIIDVRPGGRISGRVVEKGSGKPITSFQAGVTTSRGGPGMVMMGPPQLRSFTSDDGAFTLENVPPGAMVITASAPGYASGRLNINVEEGKEVTGLELQLDTGVKLVGRVTGSNGGPLSDVQVRVLPSATGGFATSGAERSSATDSSGEYSIDGLEAGEESVSFSHPQHADARKSVTLKGRETRLDVQMMSGGRVSGTVVTESGAPVADAQIEAFSNSNRESARTDANGAFELQSVTPGRYRFSASKRGLADAMIEDVDVSSGAPVRLVMKVGGTIYGRVTGLSEQELAQAQVIAAGRQTMAEGTIDATGNYRIEGVAAGTVEVQAWSGTGFSGTSRRSPSQVVELAAGGSQQIDIAFRSDVVISGRVTRNGIPMTGGQVNFMARGTSSRGSGSASTDNDGMYSVSGLEEGEYNVMVMDAQRLTPYNTTYQVRGSSTYDIDYKTNALRGRALDASTNEPLANVSVSLRNATTSEGPRMIRQAISDVTGAFLFDSVPAGSYVATASREGFANESKDVYVGDSAPQDLEMHLSRSVGITLNVVDARDGRTISGRASVYDMQGRLADETRVTFIGGGDTPTNLTLNVAPGSYVATVTSNGYAPRSVSLQSPSTQTVALSPGGTLLIRSKHNESMRIRLLDANGIPYPRFSTMIPTRELLASSGTTTLPYIAAGTYTLQLLDGEAVVDSKRVVVMEGQVVSEEI